MNAPLSAHTLARGSFTCPWCARVGGYTIVRVLREEVEIGAYVECAECFCTFPRSVVGQQAEVPPRPSHLAACLRTMVLMMLADEAVLEAEIDHIRTHYTQVGGAALSRDEVMAEVDRAREEALDLPTFLHGMAGRLNAQGKLAVIRAAFGVATADGHLDPRERALLGTLADALGVDDPLAAR